MTLSVEHEDIVDDLRALAVEFVSLTYPAREDWTRLNIWFAVDSWFASAFIGRLDGYRADFYLNVDDGGGTMFFEIGKMQDGKWNHVTAQDGKPVRVIRIGFDRNVSILHPRRTEFESSLLQYLENHLSNA